MGVTTPALRAANSSTAGLMRPRVAQTCALFALAYLPYSQWFGLLLPAEVFGFSLTISLLPLSLVLVATLNLAWVGRTSGVRLVAMFGLIATTIVPLRFLGGVASSFQHEVSAVRWLIIIPAWTVVFRDLLGERRVRDWARRLLVANTLIAAVMGIAYHLGLANIRISSSSFAEQGLTDPLAHVITQASGLFLNPNAFGAFLLLGVALLLFGSRVSLRWTLPGLALLFMGIEASGSRWSLGGALFLLAFLSIRRPTHNWSRGTLSMVRSLIAIVGFGMLLSSARTSLPTVGYHADSRVIKSSAGWHALTASPTTILIGVDPFGLLIALPSDQTFSDNAWLQMALTVGIPVTVLFVVALWRALRWPPRSRERAAFALIVIGTMTLNNASLWDSWIACAAATYWLISYAGGEQPARGALQRPGRGRQEQSS